MTWKFALRVIVFTAMRPVSAHAGEQHSVDPHKLNIAGVKLGMDFYQAMTAVAHNYHMSTSKIDLDPIPDNDNPAHIPLPKYFSYKNDKDGTVLVVRFQFRIPVDLYNTQVVSQIDYEMPWSHENEESIAKTALTKYGKPSNAPNKLPMQWCLNPSSDPGIGCGNDQAKLELSKVILTLVDPHAQLTRTKLLMGAKTSKQSEAKP